MKIYRDIIYFFCLLCVLFIPVSLQLFPYQHKLTSFFFARPVTFIADTVFDKNINANFSSDSFSLYLLLAILFIFSIVVSLVLMLIKYWQVNKEKIFPLLRLLFFYYLALQLVSYGFDKIFKGQFYLPEPNILYTPFGNLDRDILYWSTIGTSYQYNLFLGLLEVVGGVFLLFKKTRVVGLMMSVAILLHVVAVNFGFDISVKLFSSFLLFLSLLLLWPYLKNLFAFLIQKKFAQIHETENNYGISIKPLPAIILKTFLVSIIFFEAVYPSIKTKNFNDDLASRSFLHGAYKVVAVNDSTSINFLPVKQFFIHRNGYLIFQNNIDETQDYKLFIDTIAQHFSLVNYHNKQTDLNYRYSPLDSVLHLQYFYQNKEYWLKAKALNWKNLPAVQKQFHWMVEEIK